MTELELVDNVIKLDHDELEKTNSTDIPVPESELPVPESESDKSSFELKSSALCRGELCHWCQGDYVLASNPTDPGLGMFSLEAVVYLNSESKNGHLHTAYL